MDWITLSDESQLNKINQQSFSENHKGVLIFKHSTRCSTSLMVLKMLEREWNISNEILPIYFLDLLNHRSTSSEIANLYDVRHESPQVLIIKNGVCIYNASHSDVSAENIQRAINN